MLPSIENLSTASGSFIRSPSERLRHVHHQFIPIERDFKDMMAMASEPTNTNFSPPITTPPLATTTSETPSKTPSWTPSRVSAASPMMKAMMSVRDCIENIGHITRLDPMDEWLPITESRNGNALYSAFHTLCSGIGFQALLLPVAFASLGWTWGIVSLSVVFFWQLYTLWILTRLHESSVDGTRYSRYLHLCISTFGQRLGKALAKFPIMYLSGGTCTTLIIMGGGSLKLFYEMVCGGRTCKLDPFTGIEWYLVFVSIAVVLSQLPNLNSIAGVSLIGAVTAITYCTLTWALSISMGRYAGVSYDPSKGKSEVGRILGVLNGVGIVAFAFRGHNLTLEIQATMPSTSKNPSYIPMWRGVKIAYLIIAMCLFPIAIGGYWSYGNMMPHNGIIAALNKYHGHEMSRAIISLTTLLVVINCLSSFQIYAMPVFDTLESAYTTKHNRACPRWVRSSIRVFFGGLTFLISVAFPFLPDLAGLLGGVALPVTLAYPCFMWALIKKPKKGNGMWWLNWGLGIVGMGLSFLLIGGGLWSLVSTGLKFRFFQARKTVVN